MLKFCVGHVPFEEQKLCSFCLIKQLRRQPRRRRFTMRKAAAD